MTHNATISIAAKWLDDMNNASLTDAQRAEAKKNYTERSHGAFPNKPDGTKMVPHRVKTGVIFKHAKNKKRAKEFVAFLLQEENLTPYVEGSLGRWFPVTKAGQASPFWKATRTAWRSTTSTCPAPCRSNSPRTTSSRC
jgi:multiple sugar transport system substrate-binding protein